MDKKQIIPFDYALVIATYNWPCALDFVLQSILKQTILPTEIIIADDGSLGDTAILIDIYKEIFTVPLRHIWQEDKGFRKARILNKAIMSSTCEYIIQIDGDVLIDKHFIEDHIWIARRNYFVRGSRAMLDEKATYSILSQGSLPPERYLRKNCYHKLNAIRNLILAKIFRNNYKTRGVETQFSIMGCNMAFWKKDFTEVNGYNELMTGWGCEDAELAVRFLKAGKRKQALKMAGVQYHLYHKPNSKENVYLNREILSRTKADNSYKCTWGCI